MLAILRYANTEVVWLNPTRRIANVLRFGQVVAVNARARYK